MRPPTLILGAEWRIVLTVARSLHAQGVLVDVASLSEYAALPSSPAIRRTLVLPQADPATDTWLPALTGLIAEAGYDYLIPTSDTALAHVARHFGALREQVQIAAPPPHVLRKVLEKDVTMAAAEAVGVRVPHSYEIPDITQLVDLGASLRFPLVAKGRSKSATGEGGYKARYFRSLEELVAEFHLSPDVGQRNIFQEYVPGAGVGIAILMHDGEPLTAFQHRRLKELPATGGVAVTAVSEPIDPSLYDQAVTLLRAIEWDGIAMVEFRHDSQSGKGALMEVNGRYWGSCSLAAAAGLDFPHYQYALAHGLRAPIPSGYRVGLTWRWTAGYLRRLHDIAIGGREPGSDQPKRLRTFLDLAEDFRPGVVSALVAPNDSSPAWREAGGTILALTKLDLKRLLRWALPERLREALKRLRQQPWPETRWRAHTALTRLLRLQRPPSQRTIDSARSILFICHGNIIRSAAAAAFLEAAIHRRGHGNRWRVASSGTNARDGKAADPRAVEAAARLGADLSGHVATRLTAELVADADLIFVMDERNEARVLASYAAARGKTYLLGLIGNRQGALVIPDPYHDSAEEVGQILLRVREHVTILADRLGNREVR